ncbi:hypothetical protein [Clostridium intestinale]|uniref:hypothetical protein n=1 Tax=Clostridium intestinale TaxID=36845 RepID=UPI0028E85D8C|nr:hypothetical protein [Clostridium intestinale]
MKIEELIAICNEKLPYKENERGGSETTIYRNIKSTIELVKEVLDDYTFKKYNTEEDEEFFEDLIYPVVKNREEMSEEAKNFFLPLVRYNNNKIIKDIFIEYCGAKYVKNISNIQEEDIEKLLRQLNEAYISLKSNGKEKIPTIGFEELCKIDTEEDDFFIEPIDTIKYIKHVLEDRIFESMGFNKGISKSKREALEAATNMYHLAKLLQGVEYGEAPVSFASLNNSSKSESEYEIDISQYLKRDKSKNYYYEMSLRTYYRLCKCVEIKRNNLIESIYNSLPKQKKLILKDRFFDLIKKELQSMLYDKNYKCSNYEEHEYIFSLKKDNKELLNKYIKPSKKAIKKKKISKKNKSIKKNEKNINKSVRKDINSQ